MFSSLSFPSVAFASPREMDFVTEGKAVWIEEKGQVAGRGPWRRRLPRPAHAVGRRDAGRGWGVGFRIHPRGGPPRPVTWKSRRPRGLPRVASEKQGLLSPSHQVHFSIKKKGNRGNGTSGTQRVRWGGQQAESTREGVLGGGRGTPYKLGLPTLRA